MSKKKHIWIKEQEKGGGQVEKEFERIFAEKILYKEIYAPLYKIRDTISIFNYTESKIELYSSSGEVLRKVDIEFHLEPSWKHNMCISEDERKAYALFEANGITELKEIDLVNGLTFNSTKIPLRFAYNIKVKNGFVYYLHKERGSINNLFLSKQTLE